jgi:hypothetical protein
MYRREKKQLIECEEANEKNRLELQAVGDSFFLGGMEVPK